jgi:type IV pilus assembly protein PilY1
MMILNYLKAMVKHSSRHNLPDTEIPKQTWRSDPKRPAGLIFCGLMIALLLFGHAPSVHADYAYNKKITIDHSKVSGSSNISDFPVLIHIQNDNDLKHKSSGGHVENASGYDIIFKNSAGVPIAHELEEYNGSTGTLLAWVRVPTLRYDIDTELYIHYGDPSVSSPTENPAGVWGNYAGVWHLAENPTGAAPQMMDSTGNANHGEAEDNSWNPWVASDRVQGQIGQALYFYDHGGSSKRVEIGSDTSLDCTTGITMQAWLKPGSVEEADRPILSKVDAYKIDAMRSYNITPDGYVYIEGEGYLSEHPPDPLTTNWHHLVSTWDSSDGVLRIYVDGLERDSDQTSKSNPRIRVSTEPLRISKKNADAIIDEVRLSCIARSAGWIGTEYNNQFSPDTFYSIGPENGGAAAYTISASAGPHGSIGPSGDILVNAGDDRSFSISPDPGYDILAVQVDGASVGLVSGYTFSNVNANHTIQVFFAETGSYKIETSSGPNGSISPVGPVAVAPGGNMAFVINPFPGYGVDDVKVDGSSVGAVTSYTFTDVDDDHTIAAQFVLVGPPPPLGECLEVSDIPLDARYNSGPPNIMILMDDSGSMDWEILVADTDGKYQGQYEYVFDNPGDTDYTCPGCHHYDLDPENHLTRGDLRRHWKTQWSEYNKVYYDPAMDYTPWPASNTATGAADMDNPRAHPMHATPTFDLSGSFDTVADSTGGVIVDNESPVAFSMTGPWAEASSSDAENGHYLHTAVSDTDYTAIWSPYLLAGEYKVYTRYKSVSTRMDDVPYTITHAGGTDTVEVDQRFNSGSWVELGTYTFNEGRADVTIDVHVFNISTGDVCADAIKFVPTGTPTLDIKRAHYFTYSDIESKPYLVIVDGGSIDYYAFDDDGDDILEAGELTYSLDPPNDAKTYRDYMDERQNFANWYSYYRNRGSTATYAVAQVIGAMQGVRIGIYGLNGVVGASRDPESIVQPVLKIKVDGEDQTKTLLDQLYNFYWIGNTPLRQALENVGQYFDQDDNLKIDDSAGDDSPWSNAENGGECQQAFNIMVTDGYWNGSAPQNSSITNEDGDNGDPYDDNWSDTLADVAMYFYENDLADNLIDSVPINLFDDATHQHMVTYSVGFGVLGVNDPADYDFNLKHNVTGNYIDWPEPASANPAKVDDLWHAAVNARGRYLNAASPKELIDSLQDIMMDIEVRIFSAAGVSINGDKLYEKLTPDILMFQTSYFSDGWTGDVKAYKVHPVTGEVDTSTYEWSAARLLADKKENQRVIATYDGDEGISFSYEKLSDVQKSQLDANWETDATEAKNILNFLRGDQSNELQNGGAYRQRFFTLGDIVHSSPVFKNNLLYAAGNDGMLHALNADTGEELFAYVPNLIFENLKLLVDPDYTHKYYLDLTPVVSDLDHAGLSTILVGGLGKGGRGYYALDVSDMNPLGSPTNIPTSEIQLADKVLWEYPDLSTPAAEVADLGYSFSMPAIVQSNDTANAPWVVIFGNGYSSYNESAVLFILDPATGNLITRIDTQVASCNGLSSPVAVDVNYDNKVDYVYAGDLKGNLWKFDLTDSDYDNWDVAYYNGMSPHPLFQTAPGQPITAKPNVMYHCDKDGYMVLFGTGKYLGDNDFLDTTPQAIYGIWDYGDNEDDSEYVGQYAGAFLSDTNLPGTAVLMPQALQEWIVDGKQYRTMSSNSIDWDTTTLDIDCGDHDNGLPACDPNGLGSNPDPVKNVGWYVPLLTEGERVVSDVLIRGSKTIVVSYAPGASLCGSGGLSWLMEFEACTGGSPSGAQFDRDNDGDVDVDDLIEVDPPGAPPPVDLPPVGMPFDGQLQIPAFLINGQMEKKYMSSSKAKIETLNEKAPRLGIIYWRLFRD